MSNQSATESTSRSIHFCVVTPVEWRCLNCNMLVSDDAVAIMVSLDGTDHMLGADEDAVCPNCSEVKEDRTPALFATVEEALEHVAVLAHKFESGDDPAFSVKLLGFGIFSAGSSTPQ